MTRRKGLYLASTPLALLLLLSVGTRIYANRASDPPAVDAKTPETQSTATPVLAKPADAETQKKLEKTVSSQINALRKKDFATALHFAAPSFRSSTTTEYFGHMVETGYAPLANSARTEFQTALLRGEVAVLPTTVIGKDGTKTKYLYIMAKQATGWLIDGCAEQPMIRPQSPTVTDEREI